LVQSVTKFIILKELVKFAQSSLVSRFTANLTEVKKEIKAMQRENNKIIVQLNASSGMEIALIKWA